MNVNPDADYDEWKRAWDSLRDSWLRRVGPRVGLALATSVAGAETDLAVLMSNIQTVERGIDTPKVELMVDRNEVPADQGEKDDMVDWARVSIRTAIATHLVSLERVHALVHRKYGDLRGSTLITDVQRLRLLKHTWARENPAVKEYVGQEAMKMDPLFYQKMLTVLNVPAVDFEHLHSKQDQWLLDWWVIPDSRCAGQCIPPLCYFSDLALTEYLDLLQKKPTGSSDPDTVRKTWERMGLRRSRTTIVKRSQPEHGRTRFFIENGRHQRRFGSEFIV